MGMRWVTVGAAALVAGWFGNAGVPASAVAQILPESEFTVAGWSGGAVMRDERFSYCTVGRPVESGTTLIVVRGDWGYSLGLSDPSWALDEIGTQYPVTMRVDDVWTGVVAAQVIDGTAVEIPLGYDPDWAEAVRLGDGLLIETAQTALRYTLVHMADALAALDRCFANHSEPEQQNPFASGVGDPPATRHGGGLGPAPGSEAGPDAAFLLARSPQPVFDRVEIARHLIDAGFVASHVLQDEEIGASPFPWANVVWSLGDLMGFFLQVDDLALPVGQYSRLFLGEMATVCVNRTALVLGNVRNLPQAAVQDGVLSCEADALIFTLAITVRALADATPPEIWVFGHLAPESVGFDTEHLRIVTALVAAAEGRLDDSRRF